MLVKEAKDAKYGPGYQCTQQQKLPLYSNYAIYLQETFINSLTLEWYDGNRECVNCNLIQEVFLNSLTPERHVAPFTNMV